MNCQNVRTAIDAASPREPFSESVTLHLAACQNCGDYAAQMTALFALMNDVPRVQVPNDFDFRLRARLAQVKAEPAPRGGLSFFSEFWKQSFSWGQTASAMAAIALVVTMTTVYFFSSNKSEVNDSNGPIASVMIEPSSIATATPPRKAMPPFAEPTSGSGNAVVPLPAPRTPYLSSVSNNGNIHGKLKVSPRVVIGNVSPETEMGAAAPSGHQVLVYSGGKRQVREVREVSFGIQPAMAMADTSSRPNPSQGVF